MKISKKYNQAFIYFKNSYAYKMGGTQTVLLPNGKSKHFDDREYYSGRGAKYNSSIRHDDIGVVKVSRREYSSFLQMLRDREEQRKERMKEISQKLARIERAKDQGVYSLERVEDGYFVELSADEIYSKTFDAERLARTLNISVQDARLLNSGGKTYVFARRKSTGSILEIYHSSLSCNNLNIHVSFPSKERIEQFKKDREKWENAPFAGMVGQTSNENHFVC